MKNKKLLIAVIAVVVAIAALLCVYFVTRPDAQSGSKAITVTVVHKDGTARDFTCNTTEEYLGAVLVSEKIVEDNQSEFGLYILTADGETADYDVDGSWWALYIGEEMAMTGADATPVTDGGVYKLVYTIG